MKYKLIALDVDGTLLNDQHELSQGTEEVIRKLSNKGVEIVLCTGRSPINSIPYMQHLGLKGYVITHNGAATVDVSTNEVIHEYALSPQGLDPYVAYCRQHGIHFDVNTTFGLYVDSVAGMSLKTANVYHNFKMVPHDLPMWIDISQPIVKFSAFGEGRDLARVYREWSKWTQEYNMLQSGDMFVDLMHPDASKGAALQHLAKLRGIPAENVMAIGNFYNDISMISFAGMGIAMDNSPPEVKLVADAVTRSNNEEGVKHALEHYAL